MYRCEIVCEIERNYGALIVLVVLSTYFGIFWTLILPVRTRFSQNIPFIFHYTSDIRWPGSSVGIATGYVLDGPGIESQWGRHFLHLSRPTMALTQPPVQWVPGFSLGKERPGRDANSSPPSSVVVMKGQSYTSTPPMGRTACTEPQCLYMGALQLFYLLILGLEPFLCLDVPHCYSAECAGISFTVFGATYSFRVHNKILSGPLATLKQFPFVFGINYSHMFTQCEGRIHGYSVNSHCTQCNQVALCHGRCDCFLRISVFAQVFCLYGCFQIAKRKFLIKHS